jgi:hypothetical protein
VSLASCLRTSITGDTSAAGFGGGIGSSYTVQRLEAVMRRPNRKEGTSDAENAPRWADVSKSIASFRQSKSSNHQKALTKVGVPRALPVIEPSQTPPEAVNWLERETLKILSTPDMKEKLYKTGFQVRNWHINVQ